MIDLIIKHALFARSQRLIHTIVSIEKYTTLKLMGHSHGNSHYSNDNQLNKQREITVIFVNNSNTLNGAIVLICVMLRNIVQLVKVITIFLVQCFFFAFFFLGLGFFCLCLIVSLLLCFVFIFIYVCWLFFFSSFIYLFISY